MRTKEELLELDKDYYLRNIEIQEHTLEVLIDIRDILYSRENKSAGFTTTPTYGYETCAG